MAPGGYGMLVGPRSTKEARRPSASACWPNPANYIAQGHPRAVILPHLR